MSEHPLVSVLIPVYNAGKYLKESVLSIINQTYNNLEIIIIDDGCTDGCIDTIRDIADSRIRLIRQQNGGKAAALNRAWDEMQGEFFIIQDADDISYLERVDEQVACMICHHELAGVYVGNDLILGNKRFAPIFEEINVKNCNKLIEAFKNPAHDATGMYRVSLLGDMRFDESLRIGQGIDFVLRVGEKYPLLCIGKCLYSYRINYSSTIRNNIEKTKNSVNMVREKACQRRGVDFNDYKIIAQKQQWFFKHRDMDVNIIPHCMESVVQLKFKNKHGKAFSVGWQCCVLHPLDPYYYKPLIYVVTPLKLIKLYRKFKQDK